MKAKPEDDQKEKKQSFGLICSMSHITKVKKNFYVNCPGTSHMGEINGPVLR